MFFLMNELNHLINVGLQVIAFMVKHSRENGRGHKTNKRDHIMKFPACQAEVLNCLFAIESL